MACTKQTLVKRITEDADLDPQAAHEALETLLKIMKDTLGSGEDIMISGFGKFSVNEKAPRKGRNPATNRGLKPNGTKIYVKENQRCFCAYKID